MALKESTMALSVSIVSVVTFITFVSQRKKYSKGILLYLPPITSFILHTLPFFLPFVISVSARMRKPLKTAIYILSALMGITTGVSFISEKKYTLINSLIILVYSGLAVGELLVYTIKWIINRKRRESLRKRPVIKRRFGNTIRMPPISVSTESRHLRAKTNFVINGITYIRKGETVELLRTIGSYYSIRNSTGTEYIVPKTNFF
ncbi:hypothetical protein NEOKW01_2074 [Nematocida sp. AWRm80]|nr:hypothetical protein NEOKW01_2074 [Nematocida sp. AWRm80]